MAFLKQNEHGYLGGPGFGCTSPARAISRSSGSKSGPVVVVICPLQPSSYDNPRSPGPESSVPVLTGLSHKFTCDRSLG